MPAIVFYRKLGYRETDCYCTACHCRYIDTERLSKDYHHKKDGICKNCCEAVQFRQMDRGRKSYKAFGTFALLEGEDDLLKIRVCKAEQTFPDEDIMEPDIDLTTITAYELRPGKAVQYWFTWDKGWHPKKSNPTEPCFNLGYYGYHTGYNVINREAISNTFLRYAFADLNYEEWPEQLIIWLCALARRPKLEYLIHGGLERLACDYVYKRLHARINWNSNDLKKMLRLSKAELEYIKLSSGQDYDNYTYFRRETFTGRSPEETISYFSDFSNCDELLKNSTSLTGFTVRKIMNYIRRKKNRQGCYFALTCYVDYLRECSELEYDMASTAIIFPKDIFAAHEHTAKLVRDKRDKELDKKLTEQNEKRSYLEFSVPDLDLMLRLPLSFREIIAEGAALNHCVASYADRHIAGTLHILFLRKISEPDKPYYTVEVRENEIQQCRGYKNNGANNPKPPTVRRFEELYTAYLDKLEAEYRRKAKQKQKPKRPAPPTRYYRKKHRAAVSVA